MNRIFFALVLAAVLAATFNQIMWEPPEAPAEVEQVEASDIPAPPVAVDQPSPLTASLLERLTLLEEEVEGHHPSPAWERPPSPMERLSAAMFASAEKAVVIVLDLIGAMALFLGLMKVAEEGGLMRIIAKLIRPLMVRLFPEVPPNHPAMAAMILNISANALGLGNAATPFGIRAMQELDRLNAVKGTATNAMVLFLAINTSSVTLLPTGVITIRQALGSAEPAAILPTTLFATVVSTIAGITAVKLYQRFVRPVEPTEDQLAALKMEQAEAGEDDLGEDTEAYPLWVSVIALSALAACIPLAILFGELISPWVVPLLALGLLAFGYFRGVKVYEVFVVGAKQGFEIAVMIIPFLVAILVAVGMFDASGLLELLVGLVSPVTSLINLPGEALPMALLRPLSGSGANGIMVAIMSDPATGPDTYVGYLVSTMQGSTETTFYVLAVYFGAVGIKRTRHALPAALTADLFGVLGAVLICSILLGSA